ncbi:MAG: DUF4124 domain-containing protein [Alcanivorax sp.]|nr:DUF4124 domain-containing protein [Alcanivorax sp.]
MALVASCRKTGWLTLILYLVLGGFSGKSVGSSIYTWTDDQGNRHFSNTPPVEMFDRASETGLSANATPNIDVVHASRGQWLARHNGVLAHLSIGNHMVWNEYPLSSTSIAPKALDSSFRGPLTLSPPSMQVEVWDRNNQHVGDRLFVVRMDSEISLNLTDAYGDGRYQFTRKPEADRDLSEREEFLSGQWALVNPEDEDQVAEIWVFSEGLLTRHESRSNRLNQHVALWNNHLDGRWHLRDNEILVEYWRGKGRHTSLSLSSQRLQLRELSHRRMVLHEPESRRVFIFRRERTR